MIGIGVGISPVLDGGAGAAGGLTFLLRDEFTTALTAGNVDGTAAEPGPGTRQVPEGEPMVYISGGELVLSWDGVSGDDPEVTLQPEEVGKQAGRGFYAKVRNFGQKKSQYHGVGFRFYSLTNNFYKVPAFFGGQDDIFVMEETKITLRLASTGDEEFIGIYLPTGYLAFVKRDNDWLLIHVSYVESGEFPFLVCQQRAHVSAHTIYIDAMRMVDFKTPFNTDYGLVTQQLSGARSAGDIFSTAGGYNLNAGDATIKLVATTLPSSGQIEVRFRIQDVNNYWQLTIDSSGNADLDEVVAGSPTQRATGSGIIDGNLITLFVWDELIIVNKIASEMFRYTSASNFKLESDGKIESLGVAGSVSDVGIWPMKISEAAKSKLDEVANA